MLFALLKISCVKLHNGCYAYKSVIMERGSSAKCVNDFDSEDNMITAVNRIFMRRLRLLLFVIPWPLFAQSVQPVSPSQCVWRAGDDSNWSSPSLDDSGWLPAEQFRGDIPRFWVRCRTQLDLPRSVRDQAIQVRSLGAYQLFLNGELLSSYGNLADGFASDNFVRDILFPAGAASVQPVHIALRHVGRPEIGAESGTDWPEFILGESAQLEALRDQFVLSSVRLVIPYVALYCIVGIVGVLQFGLFYYDRSRRELLWLGLYCVDLLVLRLNILARLALFDYPGRVDQMLWLVGNFGYLFQLIFFFALVSRRVPRIFWLLYLCSQVYDLSRLLIWFSSPDLAFRIVRVTSTLDRWSLFAWALASMAPAVAFWPWNRIAARMRPLAVCCFLWGAADAVWFSVTALSLFTRHSAVFYEVRALLTTASILCLLLLLFRQQRQITEERALLAGELHAAREIQRMLAPIRLPSAPGFAIEVAFRPMRDIGGDFYLCRVLEDGRQRLLVGDVSGKGAAAAMTAALLIGGAEDHDAFSTTELLTHLDRVLRDSGVGGFATCLCADLASDGSVVLANAGHLPPYCRRQEIPVPPGLPLGIAPGSSYSEFTFHLEAGDSLTLISDGVVEARNESGELFGFDRAREISSNSAEEIARIAEGFGRQDDITVLTLTCAPVPAPVV
jgi:hypothetical protein